MVEIGYSMSSEEHTPLDLVRYAKIAEDVGFSFALISDHYHPWIDRQGQSPFVWSVLGAIATTTGRLKLGTGVTCPLMRMHPAIIAQAAATTAAMMPGRFFLGVGTGENLNEHVLGEGWPDADTRREMLEEAIEVLRLLWKGGERSYSGRYYITRSRTHGCTRSPTSRPRSSSRPGRRRRRSSRAGSATASSLHRRSATSSGRSRTPVAPGSRGSGS
jgi:coenzyme F420-dependent glucose-6-phosphate dehydrogenase